VARIESRKHLPVLDGFRGLAIIPVLIYHFSNLYLADHGSVDYTLARIFKAGWVGVDLFFVLSGFLITGILYDTRDSKNHFVAFYGRRVLRIFPLYYLALIVLFLLLPAVSSSLAAAYADTIRHQGWFWLYVSNWYFAKEGGMGNTPGGYFWSLAVEEQFYMVWPFLLYQFKRQHLVYVTLVVFFLSPAIRFTLLWKGYAASATYCMTVAHMEGLAFGALIAVVLRSDWFEYTRRLQITLRTIALVIVALLVVFATRFGSFIFWEDWVAKLPITGLAVLFGCLLVLLVHAEPSSPMFRFFNNRVLRSFGNLSYGLYIIHVPLGRFINLLTKNVLHKIAFGSGVFERLLFIVISIAISYMLALLSWHLFEKQVLKFKKYFRV
jgi:peptidoglycan/LPS O-acetylase OafA/YrhL